MENHLSPVVTVRAALPGERAAIQAACWVGLPTWAWQAHILHVAVAGRREILLGCGWEMITGEDAETGIAISPASHHGAAAEAALLAGFRAGSRTLHWSAWLPADSPRAQALQQLGWAASRRMLSYIIPNSPEGHARLERGLDGSVKRMEEAGFVWGELDAEAVADVRLACLQERLMGAREFDFLYNSGGFDRIVSPVVWQGREMAGFIVAMTGPVFEVALMYVRPGLRSTGLNALLLGEVIRRKTAAWPGWDRIVFRGNPDANPRTRRMCQRFGGCEDVASVKLCLPRQGGNSFQEPEQSGV